NSNVLAPCSGPRNSLDFSMSGCIVSDKLLLQGDFICTSNLNCLLKTMTGMTTRKIGTRTRTKNPGTRTKTTTCSMRTTKNGTTKMMRTRTKNGDGKKRKTSSTDFH